MVFFGHKLCDICNKNRATIKMTQVDDGQVTELMICQSCNADHNPLHRRPEEAGEGVQSLFENLLSEKGMKEAGGKADQEIGTCSACGLDFATYRKTFLLGCADCYTSFEAALLNDLRKIHGDTRHAGKVPSGLEERVEQETTAAELRRQLAQAVQSEDYERAVELRDQIRALEQSDT
jgi:protein arginine kinase activator